jgi:hypothetical protein
MSKGDVAKKELRKKLEKDLRLDLRDLLLIWSSTIVGVFMTYWFERGIAQYRMGFNMPEAYHVLLDPLIFIGIFVGGSLFYALMAIGLLRYVLIKFLVSAGIDRL